MIFDAFGRFAVGQITAPGNNGTGTLTGVTATGQVGTIGNKLVDKGVTGVGAAGSIGQITPAVYAFLSGVSGTGQAGTQRGSVSAFITGVFATGFAGTTTTDLTHTFNGVQGLGQAGSLTPEVYAFLQGVSGSGACGELIGGPGSEPVGVYGTGLAGEITVIISGGGGKKKGADADHEEWDRPRRTKRKTGLEPVKKDPPQPKLPDAPVEIIPPPEFVRPVAPLVPSSTPHDPQFELGDLLALRAQIAEAQDMSEIASLQQDIADITDIMALLEVV